MNWHSVGGYFVDNASSTQFFLFASMMISMWLTEKIALGESALVKWRHTSINALFIVSALPIQICMMVLCVALASWVTHNHWGLVYLLPNADSPWIKYGLMFFALDLLDYVYHFTMHRIAALWRFHLVHHTDQALDVSTTVREHPGETLIRNGFLMLWVFACGASIEVLILRQTVQTVANIFAHTTFRLPARSARVVGWLFITPNLHHAHHHFQMPATNCNYGDVFSLWDRLFGTFLDLAREDTVFGLDTHMDGAASVGSIHVLARQGLDRAALGLRKIRRDLYQILVQCHRRPLSSGPRRGLARRELTIGLLGMLAMGAMPPALAASFPRHLLRYRVTHSIYGDIGTYTNQIDQDGDTITVRTQIRVLVRILGIVWHREEADRSERWSGNRLVAFHGTTSVNGEVTEVWGEARGDDFVVTSPQGTSVAPANVHPSNPWSAGFLDSDTMLRADTGEVERVRISPPIPAAVTIDGTTIQTRKYEISATPSYKIWLDKQDVPIMFSIDDELGVVTFTLVEYP
jgi:sterol desaturase/sphingolipid hydroxylase (fatty acid hydroxylase superfamily)